MPEGSYALRRNRSRPKRPIRPNVPTRAAIIPEDIAGTGDGPHGTWYSGPVRPVQSS